MHIRSPRRARTVAAALLVPLVVVVAAPPAAADDDAALPVPIETGGAASRVGGAADTFSPMRATNIGFHDDGPWDVEALAGGRRAVVVSENRMLTLDITRRPSRVIGTATNIFGRRMAVHPNGRWAYVVFKDKLKVVDIANPRPRLWRTVDFPRSLMEAVDISRNGSVLYVGDWVHGRVTALSLALPGRPSVIGGVSIRSDISDLAVGPGGRRLIATHRNFHHRVTFIDVSRPRRPRKISETLVSFPAGRVAFGPSGRFAFVLADPFDSSVARVAKLRVATRRLASVRTIAGVDRGGGGIAVSGDGAYVYLVLNTALDGEPCMVILGTPRLGVVKAFTGPSVPMALDTSTKGPTRGRIYFTSQSHLDEEPAGFFPIRRH
jgi:DNA-binding beta-propeller fold protein YncE